MKFFAFLFTFFVLAGCGGDLQLLREPRPAVACVVDGLRYTAGQSGIPAGDGCNVCVCSADGELACTEMACTLEPDDGETPDHVAEAPSENTAATADSVSPDTPFLSEQRETIDLGYLSAGGGELVIARRDDVVSLTLTLRDLPASAEDARYLVELTGVDEVVALGTLHADETGTHTLHADDVSLSQVTHLRVVRVDAAATTAMLTVPLF